MVKAIISALLGLAIVISASFLENAYVQKQFNSTTENLLIVLEKTKNESVTSNDISLVKKQWFKQKEKLHIFIPHNEIKEVDLWICEAVTLIDCKNYEDAVNKLEVSINLIKQISKTFSLRLENVL